jgi:hypothetical protein
MGNSVTTPAVVIRAILLRLASVNQSAPSGPEAIPYGYAPAGAANSVMVPSVVIRPILFAELSANQSAPSGPP